MFPYYLIDFWPNTWLAQHSTGINGWHRNHFLLLLFAFEKELLYVHVYIGVTKDKEDFKITPVTGQDSSPELHYSFLKHF